MCCLFRFGFGGGGCWGYPEGLTINEECNSMIILWAVSKLKVTTCSKNCLIMIPQCGSNFIKNYRTDTTLDLSYSAEKKVPFIIPTWNNGWHQPHISYNQIGLIINLTGHEIFWLGSLGSLIGEKRHEDHHYWSIVLDCGRSCPVVSLLVPHLKLFVVSTRFWLIGETRLLKR